jgi:hypothetical protein
MPVFTKLFLCSVWLYSKIPVSPQTQHLFTNLSHVMVWIWSVPYRPCVEPLVSSWCPLWGDGWLWEVRPTWRKWVAGGAFECYTWSLVPFSASFLPPWGIEPAVPSILAVMTVCLTTAPENNLSTQDELKSLKPWGKISSSYLKLFISSIWSHQSKCSYLEMKSQHGLFTCPQRGEI